MKPKDALGKLGERIAARCLTDHGMTVLEANWRCARGEIDLIATDGSTLVFCEVKARTSIRFGDPSEAVGAVKAARLRRLASMWLEQRSGESFWRDIRFDVITVLLLPSGVPQVRHLQGAF